MGDAVRPSLLTEKSYPWWALAYGLLFVVGGLWMLAVRRGGILFPVLFTGFALTWTALVAWFVTADFLAARRALRDGTCQVVEGPVANFHPMPWAGHDTERFTVMGVGFAYSDHGDSTGFNNAASHGGPVHEGMWVRNCYLERASGDRQILRLEEWR